MADKLAPIANQSIIRQVECASQAEKSYGAFEGVGFMLGTSLPEMIGYMFAYNFSGLGSNDGGFFDKLGFNFDLSESKRMMGYNYFLNVNSPSTKTEDLILCNAANGACAGKKPSLYIRNYPISPGGNLTFAMLDDIYDLNPVSVMKSMFMSAMPGGISCKKVTLPVGSNFDFCGTQVDGGPKLGYQPQFKHDHVNSPSSKPGNDATINKFVSNCYDRCGTYWNPRNVPKFHIDNCKRDCRRIWWEETHCIGTPSYESKDVTYTTCGIQPGSKTYNIPLGSAQKENDKEAKPQIDSSNYEFDKNDNKESFLNMYESYVHDQRVKHVYVQLGWMVISVVLFLVIVVLCCVVYQVRQMNVI